jgi:hypothetical protein
MTPLKVRQPVGEDIKARHLSVGHVFLVEAHLIGEICTGPRELVAIVTYAVPVTPRWQLIVWTGAVPGEHPTTGCGVYERDSTVTLLGRRFQAGAGCAA